ncbi:MAG: hypothetical protein H0T73_11470, partial [Ardenticatenales bacterium]|nr:hypothetical protein [Ardenticatenales bacterium]
MKAVHGDAINKQEKGEGSRWKQSMALRMEGRQAAEESAKLLDEESDRLLFLDQRSLRLRYALILAVILFYGISFPLLFRAFPSPGIAALITLPVAAVAWLLGLRAALAATLLSIPL